MAIDWYAQDDLGAVWYLGEDVYNYANGVLEDTEGTWQVGRDGPLAMIMPARPRVGDVYRPENIPDLVFEEVTVKTAGITVIGPRGLVNGAIVVDELHQDDTHEDKTFAPGYGEFSTGSGSNLEALALAVPTDALNGDPPAALDSLSSYSDEIFDASVIGEWDAASSAAGAIEDAWLSYHAAAGVPPMINDVMDDALAELSDAVSARDTAASRRASIEVSRAALDLRLRYRPPVEIDRSRFELWARQILHDVAAGDGAGVKGDVTSIDWVLDRFRHALSASDRSEIERLVGNLRDAASAGNLAAAAQKAQELRDVLEERR